MTTPTPQVDHEKEAAVIAFEPEDFARLRDVMIALYAPKHITYDRQRDLANALHAIFGRAVPLNGNQFR